MVKEVNAESLIPVISIKLFGTLLQHDVWVILWEEQEGLVLLLFVGQLKYLFSLNLFHDARDGISWEAEGR